MQFLGSGNRTILAWKYTDCKTHQKSLQEINWTGRIMLIQTDFYQLDQSQDIVTGNAHVSS